MTFSDDSNSALPEQTAGAPLEVVGLLPAGGHANRISPLPCSKELYPLGFRPTADGDSRPKVVSHYLLEKMRAAGIKKAYIVLRRGKWDIPNYYGDGAMLDMRLAYVVLGPPFGPGFTLDHAYPFVKNAIVAFGFPDIFFESTDSFAALLRQQETSGADVTLGMFPAAHRLSKEDRVVTNAKGEVQRIELNPPDSDGTHSWAIAVWRPRFTEVLRQYIVAQTDPASQAERSVGHSIQAGIQAGLRVEGIVVGDAPYTDIGTPGGLTLALKRANEFQKGS